MLNLQLILLYLRYMWRRGLVENVIWWVSWKRQNTVTLRGV